MPDTQNYTPPAAAEANGAPGRRAVLASAVAVLREQGVEAVTLREVARRSGVAQTAPARLFGSRVGLLAAVAEEGYADLYAAIDRAVSKIPREDALTRLQTTAKVWVSWVLAQPARYRVMTSGAVPGDVTIQTGLLVFGRLVRYIEQGQAAGSVRAWPSTELALVFLSTLHGLTMLMIDGRLGAMGIDVADTDRLAGLVADRVAQGLST